MYHCLDSKLLGTSLHHREGNKPERKMNSGRMNMSTYPGKLTYIYDSNRVPESGSNLSWGWTIFACI